MRTRLHGVFSFGTALAIAACAVAGEPEVVRQGITTLPSVRLAEVHYDNSGADVGEAIEVSGPAGTDLTGWSLVLYNGNAGGGATYSTQALAGTIPASCATRGVVVVTYPANGIQNGGTTATGTTDPDGIALVDSGGAVVEFLSYEGVITATNGPATGLISTDMGSRELGSEPVGQSLQRAGSGVWSAPVANTFGACNDAGEPPPPPAEVASVTVEPATATITVAGSQAFTATARDAANQPVPGVALVWTSSATAIATVTSGGVATGIAAGDAQITATAPNGVASSAALRVNAAEPPPPPPSGARFSELHYDNVGSDVGEAIEIEGPIGSDVTGWSIVLYDGTGGAAYSTQPLSGTLPATCDNRGVIAITYPANGIQNGSPDGLALVNSGGQVIEFLSYEGTFTATTGPATGMTSTDIIATETSSAVGQSLQRNASNQWALATSSFGACNGAGPPPPPPGNTISFSGRLPSEPALPIGFQDQLFATVRDANNVVIVTTITWTSETPALATIDGNGVMTAVEAGTAVIRATAADGVTTSTLALPTRVGLASPTAVYAGNAEFGEPADADGNDDFIVRHPTYTASYNVNRGTPNWVSYNLEATHFGPEDRCDCFTFDPLLPASFPRYTTADYTGAGAIAGFGIDRGHMTRSFDRTSGSLDNATTYYFSNVVPQTADLNQGPWAQQENFLGDFARVQNKEVYIITGVAGNRGTLKNEGKVVIPDSTWKVAIVMDRDRGLADVRDYRDLEVIAVNMPNQPGVRNVPWQSYQTTVDAIEALTGYDLLALLPDRVEAAIESATRPPLAATDGPYATLEGGTVAVSAAGSIDPNGTVVSTEWNFGDGTSSSDATTSHTYEQDGVYTVQLVVTDNDGLTDTVFTTVTVANVAPVVAPITGASLFALETFTAAGTFSDPGADAWTASVDWGDGSVATTSTLADRTFSLSHAYLLAGSFTVTVTISDDDTSATTTQTVTVLSSAQGVQSAITLVNELVSTRKLNWLVGLVLKAELSLAKRQLDLGRPDHASIVLRTVLFKVDTLVRLGLLSSSDAAPLRAVLARLVQSLA
jgi:DNA/RNA endonuclease G (NUC1)